jgi:hypothetical protein
MVFCWRRKSRTDQAVQLSACDRIFSNLSRRHRQSKRVFRPQFLSDCPRKSRL